MSPVEAWACPIQEEPRKLFARNGEGVYTNAKVADEASILLLAGMFRTVITVLTFAKRRSYFGS